MLRRFRCAGSVLQTTSGGERLIIRTKLPPLWVMAAPFDGKIHPSLRILMCDFNEAGFSHGTWVCRTRLLV